jgi:hypothetical protein
MKLYAFLAVNKQQKLYACYQDEQGREIRKLVGKNYQKKPRVEFIKVRG